MYLQANARKVMAALELRARDSFREIAAHTGLSEQLVQYHVRKAEQRGFILGYNALVDVALLGYTFHIIYFRFFGLSSSEELKWLKKNSEAPSVVLLSRNVGRWDATLGLVARSQSDLNAGLSEISRGIAGKVAEMIVTTEVECHYSSLRILHPGKLVLKGSKVPTSIREIDDIDRRILESLAKNCRIPVSALSEELELTAPAVQRRITKLEQDNVILGYRAKYDYEGLGYTQFRVQLKLGDSSIELFNRIKRAVLASGVVESASRYLGYADLDFRCHARSLIELSDFLSSIRDRFVKEIVQIEILPLFYWRTVNYMPKLREL